LIIDVTKCSKEHAAFEAGEKVNEKCISAA
jgi:hypothetical protein